jgi:hypothetical protein
LIGKAKPPARPVRVYKALPFAARIRARARFNNEGSSRAFRQPGTRADRVSK